MVTPDKEELNFKKTLSYANGYRELGMFQEALAELSTLPESASARLEALQMKMAIFFDAKDWLAAECVAKELALREPADPGNLVNLAFAIRRSRSIAEAKAILTEAAKRFPNVAIIHYNLACYDCQENELESAKEKLVQAISIDPNYLDTAKSDSDLACLSDWLSNLEIA
jgi:tetratricopeptide (TPR) repeat protein